MRLSRGGALQTCCPVLSPWLISAQSSAQSHVCRREPGRKAVLWSLFLGSIILHPSLPPFLLALLQPPLSLPPSPFFAHVCVQVSQSCQLPQSQRSVPIPALCSPPLPLSQGTALSLSHSVSMQHSPHLPPPPPPPLIDLLSLLPPSLRPSLPLPPSVLW